MHQKRRKTRSSHIRANKIKTNVSAKIHVQVKSNSLLLKPIKWNAAVTYCSCKQVHFAMEGHCSYKMVCVMFDLYEFQNVHGCLHITYCLWHVKVCIM